MKFRSLVTILIITAAAACSPKPETIPQGTWNYDLLINGIKAGSAIISGTSSGNYYISKSEMYLYMGPVENKSVQIITETKDFKPVKLEVYNTVTDKSAGKKQEINKVAVFNGNEVTLKTGNYESKIKIENPLYWTAIISLMN
jgi:hypothetical protein